MNMYQYLSNIKNPKNFDRVADLIIKIQNSDTGTEGAIQYQLELIKKIKETGEELLYEQIIEDLKGDPQYGKYLK